MSQQTAIVDAIAEHAQTKVVNLRRVRHRRVIAVEYDESFRLEVRLASFKSVSETEATAAIATSRNDERVE